MYFLAFGVQPPATLCPSPRPAPGSRARPGAQAPPADSLYSLRARRRMATYLRLRMLELRKAELSRAAAVIERRLPVDALLSPLP